MRLNGSQNAALRDSLHKQTSTVFRRMNRYVNGLLKDSKSENVHRFRTSSRRVEALVVELAPESGNKRKLLKLLAKLRKKAGKLRDVEIQIAFLKELKIPDKQNHRMQLLALLTEEQAVRAKKLAKSYDAAKAKELRKRLDRVQSEMALDGVNLLELAFARLPKLGPGAISEKTLHAYRVEAKRSRYLAELCTHSPIAEAFVENLKRAQDEIGAWHDVLKLKEQAARRFGAVHDSVLVAALQNISRARYRRASNALTIALKSIAELRQEISKPSRPPEPAALEPAAA